MASKLVKGTAVKLKITKALDRGKAFVVFFEGEDKPVILSKRIAHIDGYVHRSQLAGVTAEVTVTDESNGSQPGYIGEFDLPMAQAATNSLLANRQNTANSFAMASIYSQQQIAEQF